jgi:hypothetical protein
MTVSFVGGVVVLNVSVRRMESSTPTPTLSSPIVPALEQPKAPLYKSNSSSWHTVREGEPGPEEAPKRNFVPEWDDVENEDERPAIAGVGKNLVLQHFDKPIIQKVVVNTLHTFFLTWH